MLRYRQIASAAVGVAMFALCGPAGGFNLNKHIEIDPGTRSGGHSTVNGSITVGSEAVVDGDLETVNGSIRVDRNASLRNAQTVNGRIKLAAGVTAAEIESVNGSITVDQDATVENVSVVNGKIELEPGARVARDVGNVNGEIRIAGAEIAGNLTTVNGDVSLAEATHLMGDLTVEEPKNFGWHSRNRKPKVVIGPGVRVDGKIVLEREVELYVSESAQVGGVSGVMTLDDAIRFSGDRP